MTNRFYTIQEAANLLGVSTKTLRRWDERGLLKPKRTQGNQRRYTETQLELFKKTKNLSTENVKSDQSIPSLLDNSPQQTATTLWKPHILPDEPQQISSAQFGYAKHLQKIAIAGGFLIALVTGLLFAGVQPTRLQPYFNSLVETMGINSQKQPTELAVIKNVPSEGRVLAEGTSNDLLLRVNVPAFFAQTATVSGELTAPNILYDVVAGSGIAITEGQTPTVSSTDTLATVTGRGATTTTALTLSGGATLGNILNLGQLSSDPSTAVNGANYYNTTSNKFRCYQNGGWKDCDTDTNTGGSGDMTAVNTGNGLSGGASSGDVTIDLDVTTTSTTTTTVANSGLETASAGLSLLRGCSDTQILKWDATDVRWECASDSGGSGISGSGTTGTLPKFTAASTLGDSLISESGTTVSLSTAATLTASSLTALNCSDCINWDDIADSTTLDASTSIGFGAGALSLTFTNDGSANEIHNLSSTGDFVIQDAGTTVFTVNDSGNTVLSLQAGNFLQIDGSTTANTTTAGVLDLNVTSATSNNRGIDQSYTFTNTANAATSYGLYNLWASSQALGTTVGQTYYGLYNSVTKTGADTTSGTVTSYGDYVAVSNSGGDTAGTRNTFGGVFSATGDASGTTTAYGLYSVATGADNNYGLYMGSTGISTDIVLQNAETIDNNTDGTITLTATTLSFSGTTITASSATALNCSDCIDFDDISDTPTLDATTTVAFSTLDLNLNLSSTGVLNIQDAGVTYWSFDDDSTVDVTFPAAGTIGIDATTTANTTTGGVINLDVTSATSNNRGIDQSYTFTNTANAATSYGLYNLWQSSQVLATTVGQTYYGLYNTVSKTGADTTSGTITSYGQYNTVSNTGGDTAGTRNTFGGVFSATGDASGTTTTYGLYVVATGADNNYGLYMGSTGISRDIVLQNAETIDNDTDGQITLTATTLSFSGTTITASSLTALNCSDCIDFDDIVDSATVDAATDINLGANLLSIDLDSTGDFTIRDGTTNFVLFEDDSTVDVTFPAAGTLGIDASATANTTTAGVINLDVTSATSNNRGIDQSYTFTNTANAATSYGIYNLWASSQVLATTVGQTYYGLYNSVTKTGADTTSGTVTSYGDYVAVSNTGGDTAGTRATFGGAFSATGSTSGTTRAYGLYTIATGADTSYGIYATITETAGGSGEWPGFFANTDATSGAQVLGLQQSRTTGNYISFRDQNDAEIFYWDRVQLANLEGSATSPSYAFQNDINTGMYRSAADVLAFSAGGAERMILSATGVIADISGELQITLDGDAVTAQGICGNQASGDVADTTNVTISDCSSAPGDIAEWYPAKLDTQDGEIVALGSDIFEYNAKGFDPFTGVEIDLGRRKINILEKASTASRKMLGVTSKAPYQVFGDDIKEEIENAGNTRVKPIPVALVGRVPVKVSTENGPVEVGDYITSSSTPGVGMKATKPGQMVGKALENFPANTSEVGKIMVFVNVSYADPNNILANLVIDENGNITTKKSALADNLVNLTGSSSDWPLNLDGTIAQTNNFVKGVELPGVEPGRLGLRDQSSEPASPTPQGEYQVLPDLSTKTITILDEQGVSTIKIGLEKFNCHSGLPRISLASDSGVATSDVAPQNDAQCQTRLVMRNAVGTPTIALDAQRGNGYFSGELAAKVIKAEKIEGLEIFTNRLADLEGAVQSIATASAAMTLPNQQEASPSANAADLLARLEDLNSQLITEASSSSEINFDSVTVTADLTSVGTTMLAQTNIAGTLTIGTMTFDELNDSLNTLGTLKFQDSPLAGAIELFSGSVKLSRNGDIETEGVVTAKGVQTSELTIRLPQEASSSAQPADKTIGEDRIKAGDTSVVVATHKVKTSSKIFVTATKVLSQPMVVTNKVDRESFTVSIAQPESKDISFDWWIVNTN